MVRIFLILLAFFASYVCGFVTRASAQVMHAGDTIQISVWQDPKLDRTLVIAPDGWISFPLAGHIHAGGLSSAALENILKARLKKSYTGQLDVTVSLAAVNREEEADTKPQIYITGEVLRPGPYSITRRINVAQALAIAGGVGPFAAQQRIQVHRRIRGVDSTFLFNYNAYKSGTDTADNINLRPGDIIIVPERGLFE
jgi:polysaccharide biosynthesis/export protein